MNENNDILKHISSIEPSKDFSNKVMQDVYAIENEKLLSKAMLTNTELKTSTDFTLSVMNNIETIEAKKKPIEIFNFGQKSIIFLSIISLVIISIFSENKSETVSRFNYSNYINIDYIQIPSIFSISIICIFILLLLDFVINNTKHTI